MDLSPLVRIAARTRLAKLDRQDPARAQARVLLEMVRQARGTRFGIDHDFAGIGSVRDF